jgi:hypothetical protein
MVTKNHHHTQGLVSTIPEIKYSLVIRDSTSTHTVPSNPGAYSLAALPDENAAKQQKQLVGEHKLLLNRSMSERWARNSY